MNTTPRYLLTAAGLTLALGLGTTMVRPSRSAGGAVPVQVTGTASVRDLDNAAQQPFATAAFFTARPQSTDFVWTFNVPAGKRLVIQGISVSLNNMGAAEHPQIDLHIQTSGTQTDQVAALATLLDSANGRADFIVPQQAMTFYADAGTAVIVYVSGIGTTSVNSGSVYGGVTGYLVNTP